MTTFASFDEAMTAGALRAVELCAQSNVELDYSFESIRIVEAQLASLHKAIPKGFFAKLKNRGPSKEEIHMMAMTFGAYIGEVFRREYGGHWSMDNSLEPGSKVPTFHIANNGGEIWPPIKVAKRLANGSEDDVWHYAQVIAERLKASRTTSA